jgi:hypothetical protein
MFPGEHRETLDNVTGVTYTSLSRQVWVVNVLSDDIILRHWIACEAPHSAPACLGVQERADVVPVRT